MKEVAETARNSAIPPRKLQYQGPRMTKYGTVRDLTTAGPSGVAEGTTSQSKQKKS